MRLTFFTHSLVSCWNHGNAHFLRGVLGELGRLGHQVRAYEPVAGWSRNNLVLEQGEECLRDFARTFPQLDASFYSGIGDLEAAVDGSEVVIVHEWTEPAVVAAIGRLRRRQNFLLLFHDTHHRAVSDPDAIRAFDLEDYDGVLAFGRTLAEVYRRWGWGRRAFVWHEAADTTLFRPPEPEIDRRGLVWIGNWGDGERSVELERFLLRPSRASGLDLDIYGVRYPRAALSALGAHGARYRGWLANHRAPHVYARHLATVHVPRRHYVELLPGIPTIRVFEALASGIPLVSAPWRDSENLFCPGEDFLIASDENEMAAHLRRLAHDADLRAALAANGLARIRRSHSCAHRAKELLEIVSTLQSADARRVA